MSLSRSSDPRELVLLSLSSRMPMWPRMPRPACKDKRLEEVRDMSISSIAMTLLCKRSASSTIENCNFINQKQSEKEGGMKGSPRLLAKKI